MPASFWLKRLHLYRARAHSNWRQTPTFSTRKSTPIHARANRRAQLLHARAKKTRASHIRAQKNTRAHTRARQDACVSFCMTQRCARTQLQGIATDSSPAFATPYLLSLVLLYDLEL